MSNQIRIGTRGSELAIAQANLLKHTLMEKAALWEDQIHIEVIKTTGDKILDRPLQDIGGKALFTKEIEEALFDNRIDMAVHSLKDVPHTLPEGLTLGAILEREDPRDVLISKKELIDFTEKEKIGTGSLRRQYQLSQLNSEVEVVGLRGNVGTRLKKVESGELEGIILAAAGLHRLKLKESIHSYFSVQDLVPAVGQGAIAIEVRENDTSINQLVKKIHHQETGDCVAVEREVMFALQASCHTPIGIHCQKLDSYYRLYVFFANETQEEIYKEFFDFSYDDKAKVISAIERKFNEQ